MNNKIDILDSINWNFNFKNKYIKGKPHPVNCRKYFSYPATFIPEIPYTLIEILSKQGDMVLDPFGGIGTTFFQAIIQKRKALSFDNNLVANEINKSLFELLNPECELEECKERLLLYCSDYEESQDYGIKIDGLRNELKEWYEKGTFNQMAYLILKYDCVENDLGETEYNLFKIALSDILTTVSSQNRGWAYIADNVKPKEKDLKKKDAIERFNFCIRRIVEDFLEYRMILKDSLKEIYAESKNNILNVNFIDYEEQQQSGLVDLIVTSPPYPKMIDYVKSQRLAFYLLNRKYEDNLNTEIGARYYRNKKESLNDYLNAMKVCNGKLYNMLKTNGIMCYILPDYSDEAIETGRKDVIDEIIKDCNFKGLVLKHEIGRYIPGTHRANNMKWASLKNEKIYVFVKEEQNEI